MSNNTDTELHKYKFNFIDAISPSYCGAKWYNATIWLGHGQTTSCHHPPSHAIDLEEIKTNPSAIHNTKHKKEMRKMMLNGVRPNECEYCWKVEDMGKDHISDRVMKTITFSKEDNLKAADMTGDEDVTLKTLEISFDRTCNFACSYCNPSFSSTWVKDIKKFGGYRNIVSDGRGHFVTDAPWAKNAADKEENNPYIQAFWKWWETDLQHSLQEIRITGGEPLMAASVWKLFDWFKDNPDKGKKLKYAINSNLVPKKKLMDRLIEYSHHVPQLDIYTSNEAVGAQSEYIRDGMIYKQWKENVVRLITEGNVNQIICMGTINSLCLSSLTEFLDEQIDIKRKYGRQYLTISLNILRFPSFQSAAILPEEMKTHYKEKLENWLAPLKANRWEDKDPNGIAILSDWEIAQVERLIDYLDIVKTPHQQTAETPKLYNDFKQFFNQYDIRRGKNFRETFSQDFVDFYDSIVTQEVIPTVQMVVEQDLPAPIRKDEIESGVELDEFKKGGGYISEEIK
jgi:organic radical activating enzyme